MALQHGLDAFGDLMDGLVEFLFPRVSGSDGLQDL
jgi:hypothetical protein